MTQGPISSPSRRLSLLLAVVGILVCSCGGAATSRSSHSHGRKVTLRTATVTVTPSAGLGDGQVVSVAVKGLPHGVKFFISECLTSLDASNAGCGPQLAQQPFGLTDRTGSGSVSFTVHSGAAPAANSQIVDACTGGCVIVVTPDAAGAHFLVAPIVFTASTTSTTATSTPSSSQGPTTGAGAPGFTPESFTAVSDDDYWVLGTVPCDGTSCPAIMRTTDGGRHFVSVLAPPIPVASNTTFDYDLRLADDHDGFAFSTSGLPTSQIFYATHDGGVSWHQVPLGDVVWFATGDGFAYVIVDECSPASEPCNSYQMLRSPVSDDAWRSVAMPFSVAPGNGIELATHRSSLWLMSTTGANANAVNTIAHSTDAGNTFTVARGPCTPGLPGTLEPSSNTVIWAYCPTGMHSSKMGCS
jgi:hypothetical protein